MSRNSTDTSTLRCSSSVALGLASSSRFTASGTNLDSSPLICSSSSRRCRDSWRLLSAVPSSAFFSSSSVWARESRSVISLKARPSCPISSRERTGARASKSPPPTRRAAPASAVMGRTTTWPMAKARSAPADRDGEDRDEDLLVALALDLREDRRHGGRHPHHGAHRVVGAVTALAALLVRHRVEQREERHAVLRLQRLLDLLRLDGPREERPAGRRGRGPLHLLDVGQDLGREVGVLLDLLEGGEVGEGLDAVAAVDVEPFHGRRALELLEHGAGDVGALLEHGRLDARHQGGGEAARGHLALLDEQALFAAQRPDGRGSEADDHDGHDQQGDLGGQPRPEHRALSACWRRR